MEGSGRASEGSSQRKRASSAPRIPVRDRVSRCSSLGRASRAAREVLRSTATLERGLDAAQLALRWRRRRASSALIAARPPPTSTIVVGSGTGPPQPPSSFGGLPWSSPPPPPPPPPPSAGGSPPRGSS